MPYNYQFEYYPQYEYDKSRRETGKCGQTYGRDYRFHAQIQVTRAIALVDCNNFYVSCERVFNPQLEGRKAGRLSCFPTMTAVRLPEVMR
jgi:DNA polymerase V